MQLCLVSRARRAVVVGHAQASSHLSRHRLVGQGVSHRSGRIPSFPIRIEWGKGEGFSPQSFALLSAAASRSLIGEGRGKGELIDPFVISERKVELEAI